MENHDHQPKKIILNERKGDLTAIRSKEVEYETGPTTNELNPERKILTKGMPFTIRIY